MTDNKIQVPGYYLDSFLVTKNRLDKLNDRHLKQFIEEFKELDLGVNDHRGMLAIFSKYGEEGFSSKVFQSGVSLSTYEFMKRMGFKQDKVGRFGSKRIKEALEALLRLSRNTVSVYFMKFKKREEGVDHYDVVAIPNCRLIEIVYAASNVTEKDLENGRVEEKVSKIQVRVFPKFCNEGYYKLFEGDFYPRLKALLERSGRRVGKYHFNFALWYLKQNKKRPYSEINVDKLCCLLKIPFDSFHKTRARQIVRILYKDFKKLGYLEKFKINVPAKNKGTKDVLYFSDPNGLH